MLQKLFVSIALLQALWGCANLADPHNLAGSVYATQQNFSNDPTTQPGCHAATRPNGFSPHQFVQPAALSTDTPLLAPGDRLRVEVSGDKELLTGVYVVDSNGGLNLPQLAPVPVAGRSLLEVQRDVERRLTEFRLIRPLSNGVRLHIVEQAPVSVSVAGAVFDAGTVRVGERSPEIRNVNLASEVSGDLNPSRMLSTALRAAGGIRPDADATAIYIQRGDIWTTIDMSGALDGTVSNDLPMIASDRIWVATTGCLQPALVRPSAITAPGIRVYLSNLSRPAMHNAGSAIGKDVQVTTVGGFLNAGEKIMQIVPMGDKLLIEARVAPGDIAFIKVGDRANIKVTAYDFSIYGGLSGRVAQVSADSIYDEVERQAYFTVIVETDRAFLLKSGKRLPITPGMICDVEILTGRKSVLSYLLKPVIKARSEALTER